MHVTVSNITPVTPNAESTHLELPSHPCSKIHHTVKILIPLLTLVMTLHAGDLLALTLQAEAKLNTLHQRPIKVQESFGKLPSSGEYGIFLNITCRGTEGENDHASMFFRLQTGLTRENNVLYSEVDGTKITLAEKKWYGWKAADNVKIHYSMASDQSFTVWVEVL